MATAYTARTAEASFPAKTRPTNGVVRQVINWSAAATVVTGDSVELCKIPVNAQITDVYLVVAGFDTNSTPTATSQLGLTKATAGAADIDDDGFITAGAAGIAFGNVAKAVTPVNFNGALGFPYLAVGDGVPADGIHSKLTFKINGTLATAGTTPSIKGFVDYTMDADFASSSN